jgi:DNA-binding transcriptional LysR family regulator
MADPGSQEREDAAYSISQKAEQGMSARDILEKSNLMLLEQGNVTRRHIDRYFYENNINPSQILEINNMDLLIDFAAIGMGVSSVVKEFAELSLETGEVIELPVTPAIEERDVGFAFRSNKGKSQALEKFLQFCESKSIS